MSDYLLIHRDDDLKRAASEWKNSPIIAVDIECENNLHHYGTKISIVQISTEKKNWIVDLLAVKNFSPLKEMLENPRIQKIFHDVSFDFRILKEAMDCLPRNVFDTSIAAQFLGLRQIGLGSLLEKYYDVKKQSKFQKADWLKRPIPPAMLRYAAKDTKYLIRLRNQLEKELKEKNRLGWIKEEFRALEEKDYTQETLTYADVKGAGRLNDSQLSVLKAIYTEREKIAERLDKPVYFVISNKLLIEMAQKPPRNVKEWSSLRGVHPAVKASAPKFNDAVQRALRNPIRHVNGKKRFKRLTKAQERRFDELDAIRGRIAKNLDIESHLVLDREEMTNLASGGSIQALKRWQQKLLLSEKY